MRCLLRLRAGESACPTKTAQTSVQLQLQDWWGRRFRLSGAAVILSLTAAISALAAPTTFTIPSAKPGAWPEILGAVGFRPATAGQVGIFVLRADTPGSTDWIAKVENGAFVILEGESSVA